jgi:hypothetical protein
MGTGGDSVIGGTTGTGGRGTGGYVGTGGTTIGATGGTLGTGGRATGGSLGTGGTPATGGNTGSGTCRHAQLQGTDICTIGDSWIQITGAQVTTLENHMIAAGVIPAGSHFDRREVSGTPIDTITKSYTNKPNNCKILVMDGGGIDLFGANAAPQSSVDTVVSKFKTFLQTVKTLGFTQHIIYSLYPVIPTTPHLNAQMGPPFTDACNNSPVDCHLVDLEPLFKGQHFGSDNTHPDATGAVNIGDAWWKAMQENCVGQ